MARYDWLSGWALRLSEGDRTEAEDLVHNAFLQFTVRRRDLSEIENIEGYLYGLLRQLRLSSARKALRRRQAPLAAVDYDTAEMCLPGADVRELLHVKEELAAVCEYACLRKHTSKAGSVLILRFFHGYYPKEIARILKSSLRLANDWLRIARTEARTYVANPSALRFVSQLDASQRPKHPSGVVSNGADIVQHLRARIRESRAGACLAPADIEHLYGSSTATPSSSTLSHIVSCPVCLEQVTRHLGLEPYSDRDPRDMLGPDGGWRTDRGAPHGSNGRGTLLRIAARKLRDLHEHRPSELLIAANGLPLGTLKLRSVESELTLAVNLDEPIDFIEVFSEQNVRLLLFGVEPPPQGNVEQVEHIEFHDGRTLGLRVEFAGAWPTVHLAYRDPLLVDGFADPVEAMASLRAAERVPDARTEAGAGDPPSWWTRLLDLWRMPLVRPAFGVVALLLAVALWSLGPWKGGAVAASELLRSARTSEQALFAAPSVVVHRTVVLEERRPPEAAIRSRRRIEIWRDAARGVAVRRLYDEDNRLAAGEWTAADGSRTLYRPGARPVKDAARPVLPSIDVDTVWRTEPSADSFVTLVGSTTPTVRDRGSEYVVHYRAERTAGVIAATLTIHKAEMRAVAQTLLVRDGGDVREYLFAESAIERQPASAVPPATFEPEPELIGRALPFDAPVPAPVLDPAPVSRAAPLLSAAEQDRLALDALFTLHRFESCLAGPAEITSAPRGGVLARATVTDAGCRTRLAERLRAIGESPALHADVTLAVRSRPERDDTVRDLAALPPAYRGLIERFGAASPAGSTTGGTAADAARAFGDWALARSASALAEARELERLTAAWPPDRLRTLDVDRMTMWLDVVRDHARRFKRESEQLRAQLETVLAAGVPPGSAAPADASIHEIRSVADVPAAVAPLAALAASHDIALREMFDLSHPAPRVPVDVAALARSLHAAERQAVWFDEPWALDR